MMLVERYRRQLDIIESFPSCTNPSSCNNYKPLVERTIWCFIISFKACRNVLSLFCLVFITLKFRRYCNTFKFIFIERVNVAFHFYCIFVYTNHPLLRFIVVSLNILFCILFFCVLYIYIRKTYLVLN
jgi:hypothetical protein